MRTRSPPHRSPMRYLGPTATQRDYDAMKPIRARNMRAEDVEAAPFKAGEFTNTMTKAGRARNAVVTRCYHDGAYQNGMWSCCCQTGRDAGGCRRQTRHVGRLNTASPELICH